MKFSNQTNKNHKTPKILSKPQPLNNYLIILVNLKPLIPMQPEPLIFCQDIRLSFLRELRNRRLAVLLHRVVGLHS
jgi:hypothetical protein